MSQESLISFEKTDRLDLKQFCERLESYLLVEHDYVEGGLVVALNAGFGAGKTTFVRMWENDLRSRREKGQFVPMPLVLNAWESDYCGEPLLAILANLIEAIDAWNGEVKEDEKSALKEAAKDVAWFTLGLGNGVAAKFTGVDAVKAGDFAEGKKTARKSKRPDFIELYHQRADALKILKEKLAAAFGGESPKIFVFIDELDRCRPDYAVSYLETIKHVFDVRGMVFVLAIDYGHLANTAKSLFGQDLNFPEYFRKFCHRVIALPRPDENGLTRLTVDYVKKYLEIADKRICGINLQDRSAKFSDLAMGLAMTPRQLQEAFRIMGHASSMSDPEKRGKIYWCIAAMTILLVFLKVNRESIYLALKNETMPFDDVGKLLISTAGKDNAEWWFSIYLTALGIKLSDNQLIVTTLTNLGFSISEDDLRQCAQGWGRFYVNTRLPEIFRRIDTADTF
jgi:hypothetical protein